MSKKPQAEVLSVRELMLMCPDEDAAVKYLAGILCPNGPVCPRCQSQNTHPSKFKKAFSPWQRMPQGFFYSYKNYFCKFAHRPALVASSDASYG